MKNLILMLFLIVMIFPGCLSFGPSIKDLQKQIVKIEKENQELKSQMDEIKKENSKLKIQVEKTKKEHNQLKIQSEKIKKENNQLKTQSEKNKKERDNALNELKNLTGQDVNTQSIPSRSDDLVEDVNNIKNDILKGAGY